ncbi:hypothetical protein ENBRE01_0184 [Enteropsectra breve]|nr:hypothetical protein ENBRE01_0184 [Enteropsectra breve]
MFKYNTRLLPKVSADYSHGSIKTEKDETMQIISGENGYRSALAVSTKSTFPLYFEVQNLTAAEDRSDEGAVRVGIATKAYEYNGPVGIDSCGYSYGVNSGYGFHDSKRITLGDPLKYNDILSIYLYKSGGELKLAFFVNGMEIDEQFSGVLDDEYWPAFSIFKNGKVCFNPGPYFCYKEKVEKLIFEKKQNAD